jgi:hypothetical protein
MLPGLTSVPSAPNAVARWLAQVVAGPSAERGVATFVAAIFALIATGTTAATLTLASGDVNFEAVGDVVEGSISRVSGTLEVRGSVIARSENSVTVSSVQVPVRLYGEGPGLSFDAADPERLVIAYHDDGFYNPDVPYTVQMLTGNGDGQLDPWETALITIDLSQAELSGAEGFTLELSAPVGGRVIVQRRLPAILQPVMSLY